MPDRATEIGIAGRERQRDEISERDRYRYSDALSESASDADRKRE